MAQKTAGGPKRGVGKPSRAKGRGNIDRTNGPAEELEFPRLQWKAPTGRPSVFTVEIAREICSRLTQPESLTDICSDPRMPVKETVYTWAEIEPQFAAMLKRAQRIQAAGYMDEIISIADNARADHVVLPDGRIEQVWTSPQRDKLRIDARRLVASNLAPDEYGDRTTTKIVGEEGKPVYFDRPLTHSEIRKQIEELLNENEREIGLPVSSGLTHKERLRNIMLSGQPVTPELYQITHQRQESGEK